MRGMFIESAKETMSEITNNIDGVYGTQTYYTLITCNNSAIVCFEHKLQNEISYAHLTADNGLSNLHEGIRKSFEMATMHKDAAILVCLSDLNVTSIPDFSIIQSPIVKSANIINVGGQNLVSDFQSDFSIYNNAESQLNDLCKKLLNKIEEITTGNVPQHNSDDHPNKGLYNTSFTQDLEDWDKDFK